MNLPHDISSVNLHKKLRMTITPKQHELQLFDGTPVDFEEVTQKLLCEEALTNNVSTIIPRGNGSPEWGQIRWPHGMMYGNALYSFSFVVVVVVVVVVFLTIVLLHV